jgi:hypothetical protein
LITVDPTATHATAVGSIPQMQPAALGGWPGHGTQELTSMDWEVGRGSIRRRASTVAAAAALCAAPAARAPSIAAASLGAWTPTGSMVERDNDEQSVVLTDGRVLVVGETGAGTATSEIYSPQAGGWMSARGIGPQAHEWTLVSLAGGGALLVGATRCVVEPLRSLPCTPASVTYRLDPRGGAWVRSAPMLQAHSRPAAVRLPDGRVLVAGGFGEPCTPGFISYSCQALATAEIYDPSADRWSQTTPMPARRAGAGAALMSDGTVVLVGGGDRTRRALRYDPAKAAWSMFAATAFPHTGTHAIALAGDRVIALGANSSAGSSGRNPAPLIHDFSGAELRARPFGEACGSTPEIFTAATNSWSPVPPFPEGTFACRTSGALLKNGQLLYATVDGAYVLDRRGVCWSRVPGAPAGLGGSLMPLPGGGALNFGESSEPVSRAAIYTPARASCGSSARLHASISVQLMPTGPATSFPFAVEDGYPLALRLPAPGTLEVRWFVRHEHSREASRKPTLIASGHAHSDRIGRFVLTIRMRTAGETPIPSSVPRFVTAKATYVPDGGKPVFAARSFVLTLDGTAMGSSGG